MNTVIDFNITEIRDEQPKKYMLYHYDVEGAYWEGYNSIEELQQALKDEFFIGYEECDVTTNGFEKLFEKVNKLEPNQELLFSTRTYRHHDDGDDFDFELDWGIKRNF